MCVYGLSCFTFGHDIDTACYYYISYACAYANAKHETQTPLPLGTETALSSSQYQSLVPLLLLFKYLLSVVSGSESCVCLMTMDDEYDHANATKLKTGN